MDIYENSAYDIQQELLTNHPELNLVVLIASVRNTNRINWIFEHYKPDIVYLYLSKDMCEFQEKDNRYLYCIEQLGIMLNHEFQVYEIKKPELVDV